MRFGHDAGDIDAMDGPSFETLFSTFTRSRLNVCTVPGSIYRLCAFALPDVHWQDPSVEGADPDDSVLDLKAYYFSPAHRRWFFGTIIVLLPITFVGNVIGGSVEGGSAVWTGLLNLAMMGMYGVLIASDRTWLHGTVAVFSAALMVFTLARSSPALG